MEVEGCSLLFFAGLENWYSFSGAGSGSFALLVE